MQTKDWKRKRAKRRKTNSADRGARKARRAMKAQKHEYLLRVHSKDLEDEGLDAISHMLSKKK